MRHSVKEMNESDNLLLEIQPPEEPLTPGGARRITARLTNRGVAPVVINRRLAIGYRDHLSRELFAELKKAETRVPVPVREVDYDRSFSPPSDYGPLAPGQSIEKTFDFFEWYRPAKSGTYWLVLHYQADEKLASPPPGTLGGIVSSRPAVLEVRLENPTR